MTGKIEFVSVGWVSDGPSGPEHTVVSLEAMRQHCRPERVWQARRQGTAERLEKLAAQDEPGTRRI